MKLRPRRTKILNVIVISPSEFLSLPPFLPIQVTDESGQVADIFLQHRFPDAEQFIFLPFTFSSVISAFIHNEFSWSIYRELILQHLGLHCSI